MLCLTSALSTSSCNIAVSNLSNVQCSSPPQKDLFEHHLPISSISDDRGYTCVKFSEGEAEGESSFLVAKSRLRFALPDKMKQPRIRIPHVSNKENYVTVSSAVTKVVEPVKVFVAVFLSRPTILPRPLQRVEKCTRVRRVRRHRHFCELN